MNSTERNPVLHNRQPSVYAGPYQVTDQALENYGVSREKFGSTDIELPDGNSFNVKDYQYVLEDGSVGMYLLPVSDYGAVRAVGGKPVWASQLVDAYIREKQGLKPADPIYNLIYFFHPELNKNSIAGFAGTEKVEMGITHLGAYYGQGVTSNSPPLYHHRKWMVSGETYTNYGYPSNVMTLSMDGVDQATLNKNFLVTDKFLNYGIRFPKDYKNSKFRMVDINTCLMFYRDWILEENYLKKDPTWFTYCAAHKTLVVTVALNLPHNKKSFMEVYGDEEGAAFWDTFLKNYYELTGYDFQKEDETDFEPLWKKEGFTPAQIKPFTLEEYEAYDTARREGKLDSFTGFRPLLPTQATGWGPQFAADVVFDFVQAYADFLDAGAVMSCATIMGFHKPVTERMGITEVEYLMVAMPMLEIIMEADARIHAPSNPDPDFEKSAYYQQAFEALYVAFGGKKEGLAGALKDLPALAPYEGNLKEFVAYLASHENLLPELLAWWALWKVRANWGELIKGPNALPEEAYQWMVANIKTQFEASRNILAPDEDCIQFNAPPAIAHMIGIGMFAKNPHIQLKTICTVMETSELEPREA